MLKQRSGPLSVLAVMGRELRELSPQHHQTLRLEAWGDKRLHKHCAKLPRLLCLGGSEASFSLGTRHGRVDIPGRWDALCVLSLPWLSPGVLE